MQGVIRVQRTETDQVAHILNKNYGVKAGPDYAQRNYTAIRKLQEDVKNRRLAANSPKPQPFKLSRFGSVASLVFKPPSEIQSIRKPRLQPLSQPVESPGPKDYVRYNAQKAIFTAPKTMPARSEDTVQSLNPSFGRVPAYLQRINRVTEENRRREQEIAAAKCPPGMRILPKTEQIEMLRKLEEEKKKAVSELNRLPLGSNATSVIRLKEELERRLENLETTISTFQRDRVNVQT